MKKDKGFDGRIFGYSWNNIQRMQQKRDPIPDEAPIKVEWTDRDEAAYQQFPSVEQLTEAGWHGTSDKLKRGMRKEP